METSVEFNLSEVDELSDTPFLHLSYLIQTLLPIRLVGWNSVKRHYDSVVASTRDLISHGSRDTYIVTGSTAEGYTLPNSLSRTTPLTIEKPSDVDILWEVGGIKVSTKQFEGARDENFKGYFDDRGMQPGYTRIHLPTIKEDDESFIYNEENSKYYLSSTVMMGKVFSTHPMWPLKKTERVWMQGPALTVEDERKITPENMYEANIGSSIDLVTALKCAPWPEIANGWKDRAAKSEWLMPEVIEHILEAGCHVVAVPSKIAIRPELEWRISFSASEGMLAREAVTDYQRQCYIYLKLLRHQAMANAEIVLSSYMFKSVFLYCCERLPVDYWKKYPGSCVIYMLDILIECLGEKTVPTYFLPENNLIAHFTQEELDTAIAAVVSMRIDPITPVLEYTDYRVIGYQSVISTFREVVKPLLDDMKRFKEHRSTHTSVMSGIIGTGYNICHHLLHEQPSKKEVEVVKHQEAITCLIDIYDNWLNPIGLDATLIQFINSAGLAVKDPEISCRYFEAVVSLVEEYPEFSILRGNLACMYHSRAYTGSETSEKKQFLLNKAGSLFEELYNESRASAVDYITYLVKLERYNDAMTVLDDFLGNLDKHTPSSIQYDTKEQDCLEPTLQLHVKAQGKITADDMSFAYFYKVKCMTALTQSDQTRSQIETVLNKFQAHCDQMKTDNALKLLQYAKSLAGI